MNKKIKNIPDKALTHGGRFHADDVFSAALLTYLNPDIVIERGTVVPDDYSGIVFDIGLGEYDHHQKDRKTRENGVPYAAFGLLWKEFGSEILGDVSVIIIKRIEKPVKMEFPMLHLGCCGKNLAQKY